MFGFLANLRDVKSSLASGMIFLFALWLIFANDISKISVGASVTGNLRLLLEYIGPAASLGLIVFCAYVTGMVLTSHVWVHVLIQIVERVLPGRAQWPRSQVVSRQTEERLNSYLRRIYFEAAKQSSPDEVLGILHLPATDELKKRIDDAQTEYARREEMVRQAVSLLQDQILRSLDMLAVQLHSKKERSWDRYDKSLAESDFRAGIAGPIGLLGLVFGWRSASEQLWVPAVAAVVVSLTVSLSLALKARRKRQEATEEVLNAVMVGDLEVGSLAKLAQLQKEGDIADRSTDRRGPLQKSLKYLSRLGNP